MIHNLMPYRSEKWHAPANLALQRILSEKLQSLCFSQVPAGSDCLFFRPILLKTYIFFSNHQTVLRLYTDTSRLQNPLRYFYYPIKCIEVCPLALQRE